MPDTEAVVTLDNVTVAYGASVALRDITASWRDAGITEVLFARADAPMAKHSAAGSVEGVRILSYFDILAEAVLARAKALAA